MIAILLSLILLVLLFATSKFFKKSSLEKYKTYFVLSGIPVIFFVISDLLARFGDGNNTLIYSLVIVTLCSSMLFSMCFLVIGMGLLKKEPKGLQVDYKLALAVLFAGLPVIWCFIAKQLLKMSSVF